MAVPVGEVNMLLETIEILGPATVGFLARPITASDLNVQIGKINGNARSLVRVDEHINLYWGTRIGFVNLLRINTNVHVRNYGKIDLPKTVIIDKGWSLDVCGTISSNVHDMTVRENGALRMSHPASSLQIDTLVIDYQGRLQGSAYCDTTSDKVTLQLTYFNTTSDFIVDATRFVVSTAHNGTVSPFGLMGNETECATNGSITLERDQYCTLPTGNYFYETITIRPGAELRIDGMNESQETTTISADNIYLNFGGLITGVGKGFQFQGPGQANVNGQGATHAGRGVGNSASVYGSIKSPEDYGSNGYSATSSLGRGGGQIKLVVTDTLSIEGTIDMSADSGNGGSGGSIFVKANTISGDGYMNVAGGSCGGGGRIAAVASTTYTFTGTLSAIGGDSCSGNNGAAGRLVCECLYYFKSLTSNSLPLVGLNPHCWCRNLPCEYACRRSAILPSTMMPVQA